MTFFTPLLITALISFQLPGALPSTPRSAHLHESDGARLSAPAPTRTALLEGRVFGPDGRALAGALVVSSAGGMGRSDGAGAYQLALELAPDVQELQVTALHGSGASRLVASQRVQAFAAAARILVDPLRLEAGAGCQPDWLPTFGPAPGTNSPIHALAVYDDGQGGGPALYVGGSFQTAGAGFAPGIARWDGSAWSSLGFGFGGQVLALAVHDDGSGPALFAGGSFSAAGGVFADNVARWDGSTWSALGSGTNAEVRALSVFDDGSGGGAALYAGGVFSSAGGIGAARIARWNGASWSALGAGVDGAVQALGVHDDGAGPALYAGGLFLNAGGIPANRVARWDGSAWSALGSGTNGAVNALASHDAGSGAQLYVGGSFSSAGGAAALHLATWDGASWNTSGLGVSSGPVYALGVHDDGTGAALYVSAGVIGLGGELRRWHGGSWSSTLLELADVGMALAVYDGGSGPALCVGGFFLAVARESQVLGVDHVVLWDEPFILPLGNGLDRDVHSLAVHDDGAGSGPALYAGGAFRGPGNGIARWDGAGWSTLGIGVHSPSRVFALASHDEGIGDGAALFAGGLFFYAGFVEANNIARWDGSSWSPLSSGTSDQVDALAVFDDGQGGGPALYVGGRFASAGGQFASRIARWDGNAWSAVGNGVAGSVHALAVHDDGSGSGPALYVGGGFFIAGGQTIASFIARWDGNAWSALGSGMNGVVLALEVHDDGSGPALYAGGEFTTAGGTTVNRIARWDGADWSGLGSGMASPATAVRCLSSFDDGTGPALFAGGDFYSAGGTAASGIARWDGSSWSALGGGVQGTFVHALATHDDGSGSGEALFVGGGFLVSPSGDSMLAKWGGCTTASTPCIETWIGSPTLFLSRCGSIEQPFTILSDGQMGAGAWSLGYGPGFPSNDGWSVALLANSNDTATLTFTAVNTSTTGSWPVELTWTGTCNDLPVAWTFHALCTLVEACPNLPAILPFCFGDGSGAPCPCGNEGTAGGGCANSTGLGAVLSATGTASIAAGDLVLLASHTRPEKLGVYMQASQQVNGGLGAPFADGLRCIEGGLVRLQNRTSDTNGNSFTTIDIAAEGGVLPGDTRYYQVWYRDQPNQSPCSSSGQWMSGILNWTNGLSVTWAP